MSVEYDLPLTVSLFIRKSPVSIRNTLAVRQADGLDDGGVAGAPAQVSGHGLGEVLVRVADVLDEIRGEVGRGCRRGPLDFPR